MSKVKKGVYDFFRGSFLTDESAFKNWRIIIFVVALLLIMISSAHNADKKVIKISELKDNEMTLSGLVLESSVWVFIKEIIDYYLSFINDSNTSSSFLIIT